MKVHPKVTAGALLAGTMLSVALFAGCSWSVHLGSKHFAPPDAPDAPARSVEGPRKDGGRVTVTHQVINSVTSAIPVNLKIVPTNPGSVVRFIDQTGGRRTVGTGTAEVPVIVDVVKETLSDGSVRSIISHYSVAGEAMAVQGRPGLIGLQFEESSEITGTRRLEYTLDANLLSAEAAAGRAPVNITREF